MSWNCTSFVSQVPGLGWSFHLSLVESCDLQIDQAFGMWCDVVLFTTVSRMKTGNSGFTLRAHQESPACSSSLDQLIELFKTVIVCIYAQQTIPQCTRVHLCANLEIPQFRHARPHTHTHQKTPLYVPLQNNRLQCVLVVPLQLWNLTHVHAMFPHTHLLTQMSSNVNIDNICAWMCMGMCADASLHVPYLRV